MLGDQLQTVGLAAFCSCAGLELILVFLWIDSRSQYIVNIGKTKLRSPNGENFYTCSPLKKMTLVHARSGRLFAPVLQELTGEREIEVLPALRNLTLKA